MLSSSCLSCQKKVSVELTCIQFLQSFLFLFFFFKAMLNLLEQHLLFWLVEDLKIHYCIDWTNYISVLATTIWISLFLVTFSVHRLHTSDYHRERVVQILLCVLAAALQSHTQVAVPFVFLCGYCVSVGGSPGQQGYRESGDGPVASCQGGQGPPSYQERLQGSWASLVWQREG